MGGSGGNDDKRRRLHVAVETTHQPQLIGARQRLRVHSHVCEVAIHVVCAVRVYADAKRMVRNSAIDGMRRRHDSRGADARRPVCVRFDVAIDVQCRLAVGIDAASHEGPHAGLELT